MYKRQILGALPAKGFPQKAGSKSLIDDGIPDWKNLPPWYEGNQKVIEINKKLKTERQAIKDGPDHSRTV